MIHALYFNGLGNGKTRKREQLAMRYLAKRDIAVEHVSIDWRSDEPFDKLLARSVKTTKAKLKEHDKLVLIGSSAGGSLALNIFRQVNDKNLSVITLCSRLHDTELAWWDHRTMQRMAYIGTPKTSQLFVDSVNYCTNKTIPSLTKADKQRITIVRQLADDVVPKRTMEIEGIKAYKAMAIGHGWGIAEGVRQLPRILLKKPILPIVVEAAFWAVLLFSIYHLARDLLQTFNLDSAFTDIGHRSHQWCGSYCDIITLPFDIAGIAISAIVLKRNRIGLLGSLLLVMIPIFIGFTLLP